eukprot:12466860-Prorocentrum_lima.AAC.1
MIVNTIQYAQMCGFAIPLNKQQKAFAALAAFANVTHWHSEIEPDLRLYSLQVLLLRNVGNKTRNKVPI